MTGCNESVGACRWKIPLVPVYPDARLENPAIGLWMKLRGVDVRFIADHLVAAGTGREQVRTARWQFLHRLLVTDKSHELVRQPLQQWFGGPVRGDLAFDRAHRFAKAVLAYPGTQMMGKNADTVTTPQERKISIRNGGHEVEDCSLNPFFHLGFFIFRIAHATRAPADDYAGMVLQVQIAGYGLAVQPDPDCFG